MWVTVDVNKQDILEECDDSDIINEYRSRGLHLVDDEEREEKHYQLAEKAWLAHREGKLDKAYELMLELTLDIVNKVV